MFMRAKQILLFATFAAACGFFMTQLLISGQDRNYAPRRAEQNKTTQGYLEWLTNIKVNQNSKTIEAEHIANAYKGIEKLIREPEKNSEFLWKFRGPNNVGGRTRALIIDKQNPNVLWAGAVSGGLWKSETKGQYWVRVPYEQNSSSPLSNSVTSMTQASDGTVYFGTGEAFPATLVEQTGALAFPGSGIFKQEGETFKRLEATNNNDFLAVRKLAADPTTPNTLYAATTTGVFSTTDAGATWNKLINSPAWDVAVAADGTAFASADSCIYRKQQGGEFTVVKQESNVGRTVLSVCAPNHVFASIADTEGDLKTIYKSANNGNTWTTIGQGGGVEFRPFLTSQGIYAHSLYAFSPDIVFIAGTDLWAGMSVNNQDLFVWSPMSFSTSLSIYDPLYLPANIHTIVSPMTSPDDQLEVLFGTDAGIYGMWAPTSTTRYTKAINTNYATSQIYRATANNRGEIVAASQSNGAIFMDYKLSSSQYFRGERILGARKSATECLFSSMNPDLLITGLEYGVLYRTSELTTSTDFSLGLTTFFNTPLSGNHSYSFNDSVFGTSTTPWLSPIALWEIDDYRGYYNDTSAVMAQTEYTEGEAYNLGSANIAGMPVWWLADKDYGMGDTIRYADKYKSQMLLGLKGRLWLTRKAENFKNPVVGNEWIPILYKRSIDNDPTGTRAADVTATTFSVDGDIAYVAFSPDYRDSAKIFRISNLHASVTYEQLANISPQDLARTTNITCIGAFIGRYVTEMVVDNNHAETLILTLGQYGNEEYIYYAEEAYSAPAALDLSNFKAIQGNLPLMPVYTLCVNTNPNNVNQLLVGTEYGIYVTDDYRAASPEWKIANNGLEYNVPVFNIRQLRNPMRKTNGTYEMGAIVVATYGRGVYIDSSYMYTVVGEKPPHEGLYEGKLDVNIYPNPVETDAIVDIYVNQRSSIQVNVYDLSGKLLYCDEIERVEQGKHTINIPTSNFPSGAYFVQCLNGNTQKTIKIIKK